MAMLKSRFAGPSSRSGRMWQWRSITEGSVCPSVAALLRGLEDRAERHHENLEVEPETPVLDVEVVPLGAVAQRGLAAEAVHLRPAGHARLDAVAVRVAVDLLLEQPDVGGALGALAHDRHLATQDVEELRQLVERVAAQQRADGGAAVGALDSARRRVLREQHQDVVGSVRVGHAHRAELEEVELAPVAAHAALAEEDRAG